MTERDARTILAEIKARADAATKGPWTTDGEYETGFWTMGADGRDLFEWDGSDLGLIVTTHPNAEFIAHARTDVDDMTAALTAVLDLHTENPGYPCADNAGCNHCHKPPYPCLTVTVITDALGGGRG